MTVAEPWFHRYERTAYDTTTGRGFLMKVITHGGSCLCCICHADLMDREAMGVEL